MEKKLSSSLPPKDSVGAKSNSSAERDEQIANLELSPLLRHTLCAQGHASVTLSGGVPSLDSASAVADLCAAVQKGDLSWLIGVLGAQALTLDAAFTDYSRRAFLNSSDFPQASKLYSDLALKAQVQCRTTVETLARLKRGGEQTVKVIHVHEGAQAVVAHTINQGGQGEESGKQPHAKERDAPVAALRGPDETGQQLFVSGFERKASVSNARRE